MFLNKNRSKVTIAISFVCASLFITGCGNDKKGKIGDLPSPPVPLKPISIFSQVEGYWNKVGYGELLSIKDGMVNQYQFNNYGCVQTASESYAEAKFFVKNIEKVDNNKLSYTSTAVPIELIYQAQKELPSHCLNPLEIDEASNPENSFEYFWHNFNDYYAFFEQRNVDWQHIYQVLRPLVTPQTTKNELFEIFASMIMPLRDGHVDIKSDIGVYNISKNIPLNQAVVAAYYDLLASEHEVSYDDIENLFLQRYFDTQTGYLAKNSIGQYPDNTNRPTILWGKTPSNTGLIVLNNMEYFSKYSTDPENADWLKEIEAVKLQMNSIMSELKDTEGLILDLRNNDGGVDAVSLVIAEYFVNKDITVFNKQAVNKAGQGHIYNQKINENEHAYIEPIYLLTSQSTTSAGEIFTMAMQQLDHVTLVGEETSGELSDKLDFTLPNGWEITLSNEVYKNAQELVYEVNGIQPDHRISAYTAESLTSGKFETYEFSLEQLGKKNKPDLSQSEFELKLNELMNEAKIPGASVAVVKSGQVVYENGFGKADEANRPVTANTPFFLASVSKVLLGATLGQVEADGNVSLDEKVEPLLNFDINYPDNSGFEPSFRHLVTHSSGIIDDSLVFSCMYYLIADNSSYENLIDESQPCPDNIDTNMGEFLGDYLAEDGDYYQKSNFTSDFGRPGGTAVVYSNFASALAGYALEQKLEKNLQEISKEYIFSPLSMNNTSWSIAGIPEDIATRYTVHNNTIVPIPDYNAITYPDGGAISSAHDLAIFMATAMNEGQYQGKQILNANGIAKMLENQTSLPVINRGTGYFWALDGNYFSHTGGDPGTSTVIWADTHKDIAIVLLSNGDGENESYDEMINLLKTFAYSQ
jgi:CubicO group peptidase (beta-lactamase class C family)